MNNARSFRKPVSFWLTVLAITSLPTFSVAFGPVGHETIAFIAQDRLSPATLAKIRELLDREEDLAEVANWADVIRPFQEETKPWHIDLPIREDVQLAEVFNFCPNNDWQRGGCADSNQQRRANRSNET